MTNRVALAAAAALGLGIQASWADQGAIFGTVTLKSGGEVTGTIRWEDEEAYWLHHFNGRHGKPRDISFLGKDDQERILDQQPGPQLQLDNGTVIEFVKWFSSSELRPTDFSIEFGAIDRLELDGPWVDVTLRDGSRFEAYGGSNDIETEIFVKDQNGVERELDWEDIEAVRFGVAPPGHPGFPEQLYGRVKTHQTEFEGLVIWDRDERTAIEKLDGDLDDGREISIEFGDIRSIISRGDSSLVINRDETERVLSNSNDVDGDNRGIVVLDPGLGRIVVDWTAFERVDFRPLPENFLPPRSAWDWVKPLSGTVETRGGDRISGTIVYDVDEASTADTLEGRSDGVTYSIPFRLIRRIERHQDTTVTVILGDGRELRLSGDRDVSSSNNGIIVGKRFVAWKDLGTISFD